MIIKSDLEKCNLLDKELKSRLPHAKIVTDHDYNGHTCISDIQDLELKDKIIQKARRFYKEDEAPVIGTADSTSSVNIYANQLSAEIPVSFITSFISSYEKREYIPVAERQIKSSTKIGCIIDEIHVRDSGLPAAHIHVKCENDKQEQMAYIAEMIKNINNFSRRVAKL